MERDRIEVSNLFAIPNLLLHYLTRIALVRSEHRRDLVKKGRRNLVEEEARGGSSAEFQVAFFYSIFHFQVVGFVSGMFLKTVCMLQLRRSVSNCRFFVSVNFGQFRCWIF